MKSFNPEKDFKITPSEFSGTSRIVGVEKEDYMRGIILDSPEDLAQAFIVYNGGSVEGARATQNHDLDAIGEDHGSMAVGIALLGGAVLCSDTDAFATKLAEEAIFELKSSKRFHKGFDYTFNNFQKTSVDVRKVGDKYVLELSAAYVGSKPENRLAETLGKPMALVHSSAKGRLNVVDNLWFNVNLEDVLKNLPIPNDWHKRDYKKTINNLAQYIASGGYSGEEPEITFEHEGQKFSLNIGLDTDRYLRPEGGRYDSNYMQARGKFIVGGAWTTWDEEGNKLVEPRVVTPSIVLSVFQPGEKYLRPPAVIPKEMTAIKNARDYLIDIITPK